MKICFATNYLPGYHKIWGGAEQACYRLIKLLCKKNYQISVLCTSPVKEPREVFNFFPIKTMEDYFCNSFSRYLTKVKLLCLPFDPVSFLHTRILLKKIKPDILHLHNFDMLSYSLVENAKFLKIPVLATIYDYGNICPKENLFDREGKICESFHGPHCIKCYSQAKFRQLHRILLFFRRHFFNFFLKKIDAFIVLSESSARILYRYGISKKKVYLIRQVLPFEKVDISGVSELEKRSILYVGWLEPRKGLHIIIEAMSYIIRGFSDVKLYAIGELYDEEYKNRIVDLIKRFNLDKNIFILGKKDYHEVKEFIWKAHIVVVPEQWENMSPVVLVEAMAQAKPIVASQIGGIPEFIKDGRNGLLADPKDSIRFAEKIIYMLKNEEEAKTMATKAREDITRICDENQILNKLLGLYRSLLLKE